jgi:hypothetical protein
MGVLTKNYIIIVKNTKWRKEAADVGEKWGALKQNECKYQIPKVEDYRGNIAIEKFYLLK